VIRSPLSAEPLFHLGPVPVTGPVVTTWGLIAVLSIIAILATRRLALRPTRVQAIVELLVTTIADQIRETMRAEPARFLPLIGTLLIFLSAANLISLLPGFEPPTAHIETAAALAAIVFVAVHYYGICTRGFVGYLAEFAKPSWVLLPLTLLSEFTRTFSLMIRLFGNIMSGVFVVGIVLSLAGLFVPIPLMALDLLTGLVQAYIFTVLAMVFIGSAVGTAEKS
jgi:F-type H+-transporting ATPase subunit a